MMIAVRLVFAAGWLAVGGMIALGYLDLRLPWWLGAGVAFLMCVYNLLKVWTRYRAHQSRDVERRA
jgi:hypothetical protein